jgi:DNA replication protein DnaC
MCGGSGYIPASPGAVHRCGCMILFRYVKELVKANIPQDYWALDLNKLKINPLSKKVCQSYLKNLSRAKQNGLGLVLFGSNVTGKTSTMAEIAKAAIISNQKVRYFTLSSYVDAVFGKDAERVTYYEDGDFLLIDELDKKAGSSNIYKLVDEFLRRMFNQNKSLILGTNWDQDEFCEHLGESTFSLLKRRCEFLEFTGEDYSDHLQDSYIQRLENAFDYFNPEIVRCAIERERNGIDTEEE